MRDMEYACDRHRIVIWEAHHWARRKSTEGAEAVSEPHLIVHVRDNAIVVEPVGELDDLDLTLLAELERVIPQVAESR